MITKAGRLSSTISQGSPNRSASRDRPMTRPITEPSAMASVNATATRASVAPRLKASAPERASSTIASATACGSGSRRAPASCEPAYQAAMSRTREMSLAPKLLPCGGAVEGSGRELARRPDQLRTADIGEHEVQGPRIGLLFGDRTAHNAFAIALTVDRERARVGDADPGCEPLPFGLRRGKNGLGLTGSFEEAIDRRSIARCPGTVEGVADDGDRPLRTEAFHDVVHSDRALLPLAFKIGTEVPERQRGIDLALQRFLRQERRGTVDDRGLFPEIDTRAACQRLQEQPALVERTARDCELLALEIDELPDRGPCGHHHRAERAGRGIENQAVAERPLARDPQPVRQHQIGRAALERDLAGFGRGELDGFDDRIKIAIESIILVDVVI